MKLLAVLAVVGVFTVLAITAEATHDPAYEPAQLMRRSGLHGGDLWLLPLGEIRGVRDIQGGRHTADPHDLNLDIGAGSTQNPGNLVLNYDVGRCTVIFNGRRKRIARFCPEGITFYVPVRPR